jgi:hypothetical protein
MCYVIKIVSISSRCQRKEKKGGDANNILQIELEKNVNHSVTTRAETTDRSIKSQKTAHTGGNRAAHGS